MTVELKTRRPLDFHSRDIVGKLPEPEVEYSNGTKIYPIYRVDLRMSLLTSSLSILFDNSRLSASRSFTLVLRFITSSSRESNRLTKSRQSKPQTSSHKLELLKFY